MCQTLKLASICLTVFTASAFSQEPAKLRGAPVIHTVDDTELKPAAAAARPVASAAPVAARVEAVAVAANTQSVATFGTSTGHIVIKLDKAVFTVGETLKFTVFTDQDCSIRIVHFSADKKATQLLPNAFTQTTALRAGQVRDFPGVGDTGNPIKFTTTKPGGEEKIVVFVTEGVFKDNQQAIASTRSASFPPVKTASVIGTRGEIKIEAETAPTAKQPEGEPVEVVAASVLYKLEE